MKIFYPKKHGICSARTTASFAVNARQNTWKGPAKDLISAPLNDKIRQQLKKIRGLSPKDSNTVRDRFNFHSKKEPGHQILLEAFSE